MVLLGTACRDDLPCHDLRYLGTTQILGHLAGCCFPLAHPPQIVFMQFIHVGLLHNLLCPVFAPIADKLLWVPHGPSLKRAYFLYEFGDKFNHLTFRLGARFIQC